jgi:hypothetical protein
LTCNPGYLQSVTALLPQSQFSALCPAAPSRRNLDGSDAVVGYGPHLLMRKKSTLKLKATAVLNSRPQRRLGPIRSPRIVQRSCRLSSHLRRVRSVAATSEQRLVSSSLVPHRTSRKSARRSKIESIGFSFESFSGYTRKHEQAQLAATAGEGSTEEVGTGVANRRNKVPSIGQSTTASGPMRCQ